MNSYQKMTVLVTKLRSVSVILYLLYNNGGMKACKCRLLQFNLYQQCFNQNLFIIIGINKSDNKMYGLNQHLIQRMQRRLKEKIYRQMIEDQQRYRELGKDHNNGINQTNRRNMTEPTAEDNNPRRSQANSQTSRNLQHESTFLPVINKNHRYTQPEQEKSRNQEYQRYLSRREKPISNSHYERYERGNNFDTIAQEERDTKEQQNHSESDSQEDKTQLYLSQCEQIIGSLKELTNKSSRKIRSKASKYDTEEPIDKYLSNKKRPSQSYSINNNKNFRTNLQTPKYRNNQVSSKTRLQDYGKSQPTPFKISWPSQKQERDNKEAPNESSQFFELKTGFSPLKVRQNNIRISPVKMEQTQQSEDDDLEQQKEEVKKEKLDKSKNKNQQSQRTKDKPKDKLPEKKKQLNTKQTKTDSKPQQEQEDPEQQQKRQKAIVKYLKKARVRGNLLHQKIEDRKKQADPNQQQLQQSN